MWRLKSTHTLMSSRLRRLLALSLLSTLSLYYYETANYNTGKYNTGSMDTGSMDMENVEKMAEGSRPPTLMDEEVPRDKSIFFVETNPKTRRPSHRLLCALESTAKMNSERTVFGLFDEQSPITEPMDLLVNLTNLRMRRVNYTKLIVDSPVAELWTSGRIQASRHYLSHLSDVLRLVLVAKYGGVYLDQDVMALRPLPSGLSNFVVSGKMKKIVVAAAVFGLNLGHPLMGKLLEYQRTTFNPYGWGDNGPKVFTDVIKANCVWNRSNSKDFWFNRLECNDNNVSILNTNFSYPITGSEAYLFYRSELWANFERRIASSVFVHYYSSIRPKGCVVNSTQPLYKLKRETCPITEKNLLRSRVGKPW